MTMQQQLTGLPSSSGPPGDTSGQENNAKNLPVSNVPNAASSSQPNFTTPYDTINPLAMNIMYTQAIAPMMQNLASQLMGQNAQFAQQASNNPMAKYMPPQFQAFFQNQNANMAQQNNDMTASLMSAAMNAPAVDQFMNQINAGRVAAQQDYEKQQYIAAQQLGANPFGTPNTSGSSTNQSNTQQQIAAAIQQAANSQSTSPSPSSTKTPDPNHPGFNTDGTPIQ
jgi:hypothetical protein